MFDVVFSNNFFISFPDEDDSLSLKVQGLDFWTFVPSELYRSLFFPILGVIIDWFPEKFYYFILFLKTFLFIYSWEIHRERQRHRQREKQTPCREPNAGLNPRTPGLCPEPKADAQPLSHPGVPPVLFLDRSTFVGSMAMKCKNIDTPK